MSLALNGTDGVTYNDGTLQSSAPVGKNLIINGNMQIAQRGTSVTGITTSGGDYYTVDRFGQWLSAAGTWTQAQDTDVPTGQGFGKSVKLSCTTANASLSAGSYYHSKYTIEAQDLQQLNYGTANAEKITLSFWIKSNKTGTYILELEQDDSSKVISQSYTISSANTWEKKTLTYDGNTADVINNDNGRGIDIWFWFAAGSNYTSGTLNTSWNSRIQANDAVGQVNLADSTSNYINITGLQLEVGTTATDFEYLQYGQQLALCQRYYQTAVMTFTVGVEGTRNTEIPFPLKVSMRTAPTCTFSGGTASNGAVLGTPVTNITTEMVCPHVWLGGAGSLQNAEFAGYTFTASSEL
jgi:hypothetical protein